MVKRCNSCGLLLRWRGRQVHLVASSSRRHPSLVHPQFLTQGGQRFPDPLFGPSHNSHCPRVRPENVPYGLIGPLTTRQASRTSIPCQRRPHDREPFIAKPINLVPEQ